MLSKNGFATALFSHLTNMPLLGAHVSASGGLHKAFENAARVGAEAIQIFVASPRQWKVVEPSEELVAEFRLAWKESAVKRVYVHAGYLVNLAAASSEMRAKSVTNLAAHFKIAVRIGAQGMIFHMGSAGHRREALARTVDGIREVLSLVPGSTHLLMENSAGGGSKLCSDVDELARVAEKVDSHRIGACFDTAHALESGVIDEFSPTKIAELFARWHEKLAPYKIEVIHCNDSKTPASSHHDRHENIGKGFIGLTGFKALAREKSLHDCAWILEVPGFEGNGPDKENLDILKGLFGTESAK